MLCFVCVCVCFCVLHAHKCIGMHVHVYKYGGQSATSSVFLYCFPPYCLEIGFLAKLEEYPFVYIADQLTPLIHLSGHAMLGL